MLTEFGKLCRKVRIDHDELLKDMANTLGVSSAYLSAVEMGKRNIPDSWPVLLADHYGVDRDVFIRAVERSQSEVRIDIDGFSNRDKELVLAFARNIQNLDENKKKKLQSLFTGRRV